MKALKFVSLILMFGVGFLVGSHWIGPAVPSHAAAGPAPTAEPAADDHGRGAAPASSVSTAPEPEALVSETRHHRPENGLTPAALEGKTPRRIRKPHHADANNSATGGDGGADAVEPGTDPTVAASGTSADDSAAAGDNTVGDATAPAVPVGDTSTSTRPAPTRRKRHHAAPAPKPIDTAPEATPGAGDETAPAPDSAGDNTGAGHGAALRTSRTHSTAA